MTRSAANNDPFELKGSLFTLTVLHLKQTALPQIEQALAAKVRQAPGFFRNAPVVIDLGALTEQTDIDFNGLAELLRCHGLVPVAVRNGSMEQRQLAASHAGLPALSESRQPSKHTESKEESADTTEKTSARNNLTHRQPVRSGQQLYASGDLTVIGAVSHGAEVLADGHIHIYGPLRGRALAGIQGDTGARIFCQSLEAELVSVAGNYRIIEEIDDTMRGKPSQVYLSQNHLIIEPLSR